MVPRLNASTSCVLVLLTVGILTASPAPVAAQYGYGGHYQGGESGSGDSGGPGAPDPTPTPTPQPTPTPTPTPAPEGRISLALTYIDSEGNQLEFPASVSPGETITVRLDLKTLGNGPGSFRLSALALDERLGRPSPSRGSLSGAGVWSVTLQVGDEPGKFPLLFFAQDSSRTYRPESIIGTVEVGSPEPLLMAGDIPTHAVADSRELRSRHRSWWGALVMRNWTNPNWFANLADDLYRNRDLLNTVASAVRIDRDRLNITHEMPPKEAFRSYAKTEQVMSKYWAETGITLSAATANEIGNVMLSWRSSPGVSIGVSDDVLRVMKMSTPVIKVGNVINGVGAAMILLDFWSNMTLAETPAEARDAWNRAGYASLDLYLQNLVANTFGAAAALPGMFASYVLMDSYNTLIGGHKTCWFNKMVEQAVDAHYLGEGITDTRAVDKVMQAMRSRRGLERTLNDWWALESETWAGMMAGGCGNWDLNEAMGYRKAFVDRIMRSAEVEVDGKKYYPWSFYYSVSRKLALEKQKELAREIAEGLREIEAAYVSSLQKRQFSGTFRLVSANSPDVPLENTQVQPLEWEAGPWWQTDQEGHFTAQVNGHHFSPNGDILLVVQGDEQLYLFVVSRSAFVEVTP